MEASTDWLPTWSRDGRSIYFTSDRTGRREIWRISPDTRQAHQITRSGGFEPIESLDGNVLYYLQPPLANRTQLKQVPVGGGEETVVLEHVPAHLWSVTEKGICFLTRQSDIEISLNLYRPGDEMVSRIGRLPPFTATPIGGLIGGIGRMTVSRDGRWALTLQEDHWERDVAMIDNFH